MFAALESSHGYQVTDLPTYAGSTCTLFFPTMDEALAAELFIKNSPIITYLKRKLAEKARGLVFRYVKAFDLSQIKTGYEIPAEFDLSEEEIDSLQ